MLLIERLGLGAANSDSCAKAAADLIVAGLTVAGSIVAGLTVAGSDVADSDVADSDVAGSDVAGSDVAPTISAELDDEESQNPPGWLVAVKRDAVALGYPCCPFHGFRFW
jgi:hypothetical protein